MKRDLAKALRWLRKAQKDLQMVIEVLEKMNSEQIGQRASQHRPAANSLLKDLEVWHQKWKELVVAFEQQGTDAVEAFVRKYKKDFLLQFLRHNNIPISGGKPSKRQIVEELVQRLREEQALKRSGFTRPPRSLQGNSRNKD